MTALGRIYRQEPALWYGNYRERQLTTALYAFARGDVIVTVNNGGGAGAFDLPLDGAYRGALTGRMVRAENGRLHIDLDSDSGEIWLPEGGERKSYEPLRRPIPAAEKTPEPIKTPDRASSSKPYEDMTVEELQAEILAKLAMNGPVTDRMRRDVMENVYRDSLLNWIRSFR